MRLTRTKWLVPCFNLFALLVLWYLLLPVIAEGRLQLFPETYSDASNGLIGWCRFRLAGRFAIRFLTLSPAISPAVYLPGGRQLVPLRKRSGFWAVALAAMHLSVFFSEFIWRKTGTQSFVYFGQVAF